MNLTRFDPRAIQMHESGTGFSFRETMAGGFTLGVAEPCTGSRATTLLTMHATIHIEDIKTFIARSPAQDWSHWSSGRFMAIWKIECRQGQGV